MAWLAKRKHNGPHQECPPWRHIRTKKEALIVMIGVDPHKASHTAVAVDPDEHVLDKLQVRADRHQTNGC
jgi:hypothetical protein